MRITKIDRFQVCQISLDHCTLRWRTTIHDNTERNTEDVAGHPISVKNSFAQWYSTQYREPWVSISSKNNNAQSHNHTEHYTENFAGFLPISLKKNNTEKNGEWLHALFQVVFIPVWIHLRIWHWIFITSIMTSSKVILSFYEYSSLLFLHL